MYLVQHLYVTASVRTGKVTGLSQGMCSVPRVSVYSCLITPLQLLLFVHTGNPGNKRKNELKEVCSGSNASNGNYATITYMPGASFQLSVSLRQWVGSWIDSTVVGLESAHCQTSNTAAVKVEFYPC